MLMSMVSTEKDMYLRFLKAKHDLDDRQVVTSLIPQALRRCILQRKILELSIKLYKKIY